MESLATVSRICVIVLAVSIVYVLLKERKTLATANVVVHKVDQIADKVDKVIDKYFPTISQ
jgi:hypothetical protein